MAKRIHLAKIAGLPIVFVALVSHHTFSQQSFSDWAAEISGFILLETAALGRLWAASFISGRKNAELVTDGPYSIVRNPLYLFSFLGFVGAGLAFESFILALAFGLLFFFTHWPTILREERYLALNFGESFRAYTRGVPRFIPHPWKLRLPSTVSISPRIFSRAMLESAMVLCIFLVAQVSERIHTDFPSSVLFHIP